METMKILFMGTPDIARSVLESVLAKEGVEVVGVVTQPDRQKGRGMKVIYSPVKELALEKGIEVYQPTTFRDGAFSETLSAICPDMIMVVAYGKILPHYIIEYPRFGCINAHASILPKYRGASPIQRAIIDGERETGVCAMYMDDGLDTGDVVVVHKCDITDDDDFGTLHNKLAQLASRAMTDVIDLTREGKVTRTPQTNDGASYAAKIEKEDTVLDFSRSPETVRNLIRGLSPMPYALTKTPDGKLLKITSAFVAEGESSEPCGTVVSLDCTGEGAITVSCGGGLLSITGVVPEGKKKMSSADFIRGRKIALGDVLCF